MLIRGKQLENAAISGNKLSANSVLQGHLANSSVGNAQIIDNSIQNSQLRSAAVSGNSIAAGSILAGHIAANAVGQSAVANGFVDLSTAQTISGGKIFHNGQTAGNPINTNDIANKGYVDSKVGTPSLLNKNMGALVTSSDGDKATAVPIAGKPSAGGWIQVMVNGCQAILGDGVTNLDCYFGVSDTNSVRAIASVTSGDTLRWNGSKAGFQLDAVDKIDFNFSA